MKDVTSTEVPALLGLSPWLTPFELYHRKTQGVLVEMEDNERMRWGRRLQNAIAEGIAEDQNWSIKHLGWTYARIPELRIGASFDSEVTDREVSFSTSLLEVKNVDGLAFKEGWLVHEDDTVEAPLHIELQVQTQLLLSSCKTAYIGALVGGNHAVLIKRVRDEAVQGRIIEEVVKFWKSVKEGTPPAPDFHKDYEFIKQLYSSVQKGKILTDVEEQEWLPLAKRYAELGKTMKVLEEDRNAVKAELMVKTGDAEKVQGKGFSISAGIVKTAPVAYERPDYRNFRIYLKGDKK